MDRRQFVKAIGVSSASLTLAGCTDGNQPEDSNPGGSDDETDQPEPTDEPTESVTEEPQVEIPDPLVLGKPAPILQSGSMAAYPGLYNVMEERHDVELRLQSFGGYTPMVGGFIQGDVHFGYIAVMGWVNAVLQNIPLTGFCGFTTQFPSVMMVPSGTEWSDLEGGTVAVHAPGSSGELIAMVMAREELGSVDAVELEYIIGTPNRLAAMREGRVDATVGLISNGYSVEADGDVDLLTHPWDYEAFDNTIAQAFVLTQDRIDQNPEMVQAITDGIVESYDYMYNGDPTEITEQALEHDDYSPFGEENWQRALENNREIGVWDGDLSDERVTNTLDLLSDLGVIEEKPAIEELVTREFI